MSSLREAFCIESRVFTCWSWRIRSVFMVENTKVRWTLSRQWSVPHNYRIKNVNSEQNEFLHLLAIRRLLWTPPPCPLKKLLPGQCLNIHLPLSLLQLLHRNRPITRSIIWGNCQPRPQSRHLLPLHPIDHFVMTSVVLRNGLG